MKPYIVEFDENGAIKNKEYFINYVVEGNKCQLIIIITHDKYIFSVNDRVWKVWTWEEDRFL